MESLSITLRVVVYLARQRPNISDAWVGYIAGTLGFQVEVHLVNWANHQRAVDPIRNQQMLDSEADLAIAFLGGGGLQDMINRAESAGVPVDQIQPKLAETQVVGLRGMKLRWKYVQS